MRATLAPKAQLKSNRTEAREINRTTKEPKPLDILDRHLRDDPGQITAFVSRGEVFITKHAGRLTHRIKIGQIVHGATRLHWEDRKYSLDLRKLPQPITREPRKQGQEVSLPPARAVSMNPSRMSATDAETGAVIGLPTQRTDTDEATPGRRTTARVMG